jgi:Phage integrase, N-terminal SAM-like domain
MTSLIEKDFEDEQQNNDISTTRIQRRRAVGVIPSSFSHDYVTNEKVKHACKGLLPNIQRLILELPSDQDKLAPADFIIDCYEQQDVSIRTRQSYFTTLIYLSRYFGHKKHFAEMTREGIFSYLNGLKKDSGGSSNSNNSNRDGRAGYKSWKNTYNQRSSVIAKFFKWYTQPDLKPKERQLPPILRGPNLFYKQGENVSPSNRFVDS